MTGAPSILAELLAECEAHGIRLLLAGEGRLTIDAPEDTLTHDLLDRMKAHKAELLKSIERFEERAAIMEFDAGLSRHDAERLAWNEYFSQRTVSEKMTPWPARNQNSNEPN